MTQNRIDRYGVKTFSVPASQSVAISNYGGGIASIFYETAPGNTPEQYILQQILNDSAVTLGPMSVDTTVKIESGRSIILYEIGASPELAPIAVDDTPVNGSDKTPVSSNWAYDHIAAADPHTVYPLDTEVLKKTGAQTLTGSIKFVGTAVGGIAADSNEDDIVLESTNSGMTITSDAAGVGTIAFGDQNAKRRSRIFYYHGQDYICFEVNGVALQKFLSGIDQCLIRQSTPTAKTTDATLTAAEIQKGIITVNNGAAGTTTLTLPLATDFEAAFVGIENQNAFDFIVINISTVAGEDCTIATNTGWTLVGSMVVEAYDDPRARSSAKFRARRTGTNTYSLYRIN